MTSKNDERAAYPWPLKIFTDGAKSLQNYGRYYFDLMYANGFNLSSHISSGLFLPGHFRRMFAQDIRNITSTASFRILKLTIYNILSSVLQFFHGEGPVFDVNGDNVTIRVLFLCLRTLYYVLMYITLFILPTLITSTFTLGIIYLSFGFGFSAISAGCIVSFIIINFVIRFWLINQDTENPSFQSNADATKKIIYSAEAGVHELADLTEVKPDECVSGTQSTNLIRRALRWHMSLFNFYDRIYQPLIELHPELMPEESRKE